MPASIELWVGSLPIPQDTGSGVERQWATEKESLGLAGLGSNPSSTTSQQQSLRTRD